jgi:DNA-directed RNA polymerase specialized sigma24 family protein
MAPVKKPITDHGLDRPATGEMDGVGGVWGIRPRRFETTHWSVVQAAGAADSPGAVQALETLCRTYWRPVFVYIRGQGVAAEAAKDLTQEYFHHLIASNIPAQANARKGKFRSFLLLTLRHFLTDEFRRARKGRSIPASFLLPIEASELRFLSDESSHMPAAPEAVFDRSWAQSVVQATRRKLEAECQSSGRHEFYQTARDFLPGGQPQRPYAEVARTLQMDLNVVKIRIHRLRERFGELLREEIAHTVSTPAEVDEELNYLIAVLSVSGSGSPPRGD